MGYLSLILFTPLVGALLILFVPKTSEDAIRWIANLTAFVGFLVSIPLWYRVNPQDANFQLVERFHWIPLVGADYFLGVDGLSTLLILLTTLMLAKERAKAGRGVTAMTSRTGCSPCSRQRKGTDS